MSFLDNRTPLVLAVLLLSGCASLAPDYQRPVTPVPAQWPDPDSSSEPTSQELSALYWREVFVDVRLRKLVELALTHNRDLRIAALAIEKTRAQYQIERSALFPSVQASAAGSVQRVPVSSVDAGSTRRIEEYSVGLGFTAWELDLFGRVSSLKDQALEQFLASEQAARSTRISLIAEVVNTYLVWSADTEQLRLAVDTLTSQRASYDLTRYSFDAGIASELDLSRAQIPVDAARIDIAVFTSQVSQDRNALALLLGTDLPADLQAASLSDLSSMLSQLPVGLPGTVLLRRPDVNEAEHRLRAANANIGAARAAFYPSVTLTASTGTASDSLSGLFSSGSDTWTFLPQVTLPIFTAGRNQANLEYSEAERDSMLAQYEQTLQTAFREVADTLVQRANLDAQLDAQSSLTDATRTSYRLSETRYRRGVDSYLGVLDAQRAQYAAEQDLIAVQLTQASNRVALYKVLGGGDEPQKEVPNEAASQTHADQTFSPERTAALQ